MSEELRLPEPRFGIYGVAVQLALALFLVAFVGAQGTGELGPSDHIQRGFVLGLLFAVPGVIAALGVRGSRPSLLVAAVVMDMAGVLLSFATLVFVVPAGMFIAHAAATATMPPRLSAVVRSAVVGVAVIALVVGAGIALLTTTESRCWTAYNSPTGMRYTFSPYVDSGETSVPTDAVAAGCDTGLLSAQGEATAAALAIGAIVLAGLAARRRPEPAEG